MDKYNILIDTGKDGLHCILFKNRDGLDKKEIFDIFSKYGKIHNVKFHGDQTGICFVRYEHIDDAIRAIESLEEDPIVTLLAHKRKQKNGSHSEQSQGNDHKRQNYNGARIIQQFGKQANQENDILQHNRNRDFLHENLSWASKRPNENQKQNDMPWAEQSPNRSQWLNSTVGVSNNPNGYQGNSDGLPELVNACMRTMAEIPNQSTEIPDLVTANGRKLSTSCPIKKQIITAQEVIVANIHPQFGAPYILHLFDNYEPLAVTNIIVEPKTGKRYCHVYFKSAKESQQVETSFDKKLLLDQRLVVIQSNRLVDSAYFK